MSTIPAISTSLASSLVSATTAPQTVPKAITPLIGSMPPGTYASRIVSVSDVVQNGIAVAVDFVHELTPQNGGSILARFRYYERDLNTLVTTFARYGLEGSLDVVAIGLAETVTIAPKSNSSYLHISARQLQPTATPASAPPTAAVSVSAGATVLSHTPSQSGSTPSNKRRGGLLGSKRPTPSVTRPVSSQANLLVVEDDEDDEDFLLDDADDE